MKIEQEIREMLADALKRIARLQFEVDYLVNLVKAQKESQP